MRQAFLRQATLDEDAERPVRAATSSARTDPGWAAEAAALRADVEALRGTVAALAAELRELKTDLGV